MGLCSGAVQVELNQDYVDSVMAPQAMQQVINLHNSGLLSKRDVIWNTVQNELVEPNGRTVEEIEAELEREKPILMGTLDPAVSPPPNVPGSAANGANGATPGRRQRRKGDDAADPAE
jgi:hypothetical protein